MQDMPLLHHGKYAGNISIHSYIQKKILDKDQTSIPIAVGYW